MPNMPSMPRLLVSIPFHPHAQHAFNVPSTSPHTSSTLMPNMPLMSRLLVPMPHTPHAQCVFNVLCLPPHWSPLHLSPATSPSITVLSKPLWHLTWPVYGNFRVTMLFMS
ncbi:hypothetical protein BsWGS_16392 [Bradybaena similaris]